ncbi:hypothetical protein SAMN05192545_2353 [Maribacter dokdonensis]|uniref:Uncharacterized protein n=1 Tax=Maribacter dokdonensis TaxID=320912 RepID=A0ABY0UMP7_9FLAO|nr:hypothetical protein SAMN05192545_2353 [Maribacter dokdonensis]
MTIIIIYNFKNNKNTEILLEIFNQSIGKLLFQNDKIFCYKCELNNIYNICLKIYEVFNSYKTLKTEDEIKILHINELETHLKVIRLKKEGNKRVNKLSFAHLNNKKWF